MPLAPISLPADVIDYLRGIFVEADDKLTKRLELQPNVHEESLDLAFIDAVAQHIGPYITRSDTVVTIDIEDIPPSTSHM